MDNTTNQQGRPPLTEKQQKRLAMLQSLAGTPKQRRQVRYVKPLLVLFLGGIAFVIGAFVAYGNPADEPVHDSWVYLRFGPAGSSILMGLIGAAMLLGAAFVLRKVLALKREGGL